MTSDHDFLTDLYFNYLNYRQPGFPSRRIKHNVLQDIIKNNLNPELFEVICLGSSVEDRELNLISFGKGRKKVLMWSQMHGNESTATMALFDLINFLAANDHFNEFRKKVSEELTLYMFPMVNPDGAEMFERRNAHFIDLNRDVIDTKTPEAKILKDLLLNIKADFAFNLHDQDPNYTAGQCSKTAAISFLAPPFDFERNNSKSRLNAMKLISQMANTINHYIPGHIGKYTDEFEPRAFGDFSQSLGISTILIESGWWPGDPEKQFIRKINLLLFANALKSIAENGYKHHEADVYEALPFNAEIIYDVIVRNVKITKNNSTLTADVALTKIDADNYLIEDIGDLSTYYGYKEFNSDELHIVFNEKDLRPKINVQLSISNKKGELFKS